MVGVSKADVADLDFLDAEELQTDGSFVFLTTTVASTNSGTQTVTIDLPADGEGIKTGRDHIVEPGDKVELSGTSGGLGDGIFTVATVPTDLTFTVVEAIGTSTGGSIDFKYVPGAEAIGFNTANQNISSFNDVQRSITEVANAALLDDDPGSVGVTYAVTYVGNKVTQELWTNTSNAFAIKRINYTFTDNRVTTEVRRVFSASDGTTIIAQKTINYTYAYNVVTGATSTRDI